MMVVLERRALVCDGHRAHILGRTGNHSRTSGP